MKLSYRDKVIFIAAIIIVIAVVGIFVFIKPAYEKMNAANDKLKAKQNEQSEVQAKIDTLPQLVEQLKATADEIGEIQTFFFTPEAPYVNEQYISDILKECNLEYTSIITSYATGGDTAEYLVRPKNVASYPLLMQADLYHELPQEVYDDYNKVAFASPQTVVIGTTSVEITYKGLADDEKLFAFINKIAENEKTIIIPSFGGKTSAGVDAEETTSSSDNLGNISVRIYSLFPLNVEKVKEESDTVEIVT